MHRLRLGSFLSIALVLLGAIGNQCAAFFAPQVSNPTVLYGKRSAGKVVPAASSVRRSATSKFIYASSPLRLSSGNPEDSHTETPSDESSSLSPETQKVSVFTRLKYMLGFKKDKDADGLTTRERLAKIGLSALLSYGWVSNMSYSVSVSLAWYGFSKKTGLSPLAPGQWKGFLAVYAGFYVFNNIIRPLRFGASVVVAKYFDDVIEYIQRKTNLSRSLSISLVIFLANVCGTFAAMALGISLASAAAGVPIFPPKA